MAIVIKELDEPESCYDCPFCDYEFGMCLADAQERYTEGYGNVYKCMSEWTRNLRNWPEYGKPTWCPVKEYTEE